ncbi:anthranilate synthase component II [Porphyromonas somerae]|uniref:Glutamine amidotransferase, class I n=1 Tax=Porphyromonas somerae TaxID=322095 RepID=A0A134BAZ4_9PORP|nr:aminodeoxychorismate/anthranilate synthase component II [Porphyromonas somerae]KXB75865.1 glutamine amidotransferase, class I [Porphyromonadaceae bacterium KA00676]KXB77086.1 glutamine amidotransferase, class I [Porphyromonas somerae]
MGSTVHLLVINNRDSFVYNVVELLRSLPELTFEVIPEGELEFSSLPEHDGLILSPGPGVPSEFPRMQALIRAEAGVKPILGICLGHQALAEHYGATLVQLPAPRHGHASALEVIDPTDSLVGAIPTGSLVGRYHSWAVDEASLPTCLVPTAYCADAGEGRVLMAMRHRTEPVWSVQFHPESMISEHGRAYLLAFATAVRAWRR